MRIAVAYQDGEIYEHFGHARLFAIYDYEGADVTRCTKKLVETGERHGHRDMAELMRAERVDAVIAGAVTQFWTDVMWRDVDYMFVDMPPGTGDVPLTVFQSLPVDGIIIVTTPQDLVGMIVEKAVHMAELMKIPVIGLVENMSYFKCPDCGKEHAIFGESKVEALAKQYGIAHWARLPIDPAVTAMVDAGEVESVSGEHISAIVDVIEKEV